MGIGGLGTRSNRLQEGIGGFYKGSLGRNGHQYKVDGEKQQREGNHAAQQEIESSKILFGSLKI